MRWVARWVSLSCGDGMSGDVNLSKSRLSLFVSPLSFLYFFFFFPSFFTFVLVSFGFAVLDCWFFFFFFFLNFFFKGLHGLAGRGS